MTVKFDQNHREFTIKMTVVWPKMTVRFACITVELVKINDHFNDDFSWWVFWIYGHFGMFKMTVA